MKPEHEPKRDVRQEVTDKIVDLLEQGVMPWRKGWSGSNEQSGATMVPRNGESGRSYSGGNRLNLMCSMIEKGWQDPRFFTFNQLRNIDAGPEKGSRGSAVEYWDRMPFWKRKDVDVLHHKNNVQVLSEENGVARLKNGAEVYTSHLDVRGPDGRVMRWDQAEKLLDLVFTKHSVVFNVEQCKGLEGYLQENPLILPAKTEVQLDQALGTMLKGMQRDRLTVEHLPQDRAYYNRAQDKIVMPMPEQFVSTAEYRSTLLHEFGHATGHGSRLDRESLNKHEGFGSKMYAREELVAELTSAYAAAETGIERLDDSHASYIDHWVKALKAPDGKNELFAAARDADKATDYLLKQAELERERENGRERGGEKAKEAKEACLER